MRKTTCNATAINWNDFNTLNTALQSDRDKAHSVLTLARRAATELQTTAQKVYAKAEFARLVTHDCTCVNSTTDLLQLFLWINHRITSSVAESKNTASLYAIIGDNRHA